MIVKTAQYEVRPEELSECLRAIEAYVTEIDAAQRFTGVLYPNTLAPVEFSAWEPVAMVDRTA